MQVSHLINEKIELLLIFRTLHRSLLIHFIPDEEKLLNVPLLETSHSFLISMILLDKQRFAFILKITSSHAPILPNLMFMTQLSKNLMILRLKKL